MARALALCALILPITAWAETPIPSPDLPAFYNPAQSFKPLVQAVRDAVVAVEVKRDGGRSSDASGFIVSAEGWVLTNHHVVAGASRVRVVLQDGARIEAQLVGSDAASDIALLRLPSERAWPHLALASSQGVGIGDWVLAMGNPLGLGYTVTAGIISGEGRLVAPNTREALLQTDAAINPGNSGGPLLSVRGEVIGMNSAVMEDANNVGFAIPSDVLALVMEDLKDGTVAARGTIGVSFRTSDGGVLVSHVDPKKSGYAAGLRVGDLVVAVATRPVADELTARRAVESTSPGRTLDVDVMRGGQRTTLTASVTELSVAPGAPVVSR